MVINVALTGAVPGKADNPTVPLTPEEIVDDVLACADAGATVFHIHVRDESGDPVHRRDLYERTFGPIRDKAPELVLVATTSSRVDPAPQARVAGMDLGPGLRPDMASLTLGSFNFPRSVSNNPPDAIVGLLEKMAELGVRPELEVFELGMVNTLWALSERGLIPDPPVVNILLGSNGSAPAFVGDLAHIVDRLPPDAEWAAAGVGIFQRPMVVAAAIMDGNVRTGLEDNPRGTDPGTWSNVEAVRQAVAAAALAGRPVATAAETRARFGLRSVPQ
ncbi:MAG: 3-keto-5-aminohexanoate cleavage protein [Acidimicrobiales bacterium]